MVGAQRRGQEPDFRRPYARAFVGPLRSGRCPSSMISRSKCSGTSHGVRRAPENSHARWRSSGRRRSSVSDDRARTAHGFAITFPLSARRSASPRALARCAVARLAVASQAVVIEDAIGEVGVLLHFAENHARADRVGACRRERKKRRPCAPGVRKTVLDRASSMARRKFSRVTSGFRPRRNSAPGVRANGVPHFGFAASAGGRSCRAAYSSSGWTCTESLSSGKMNFTSSGKSRRAATLRSASIPPACAARLRPASPGEWSGGERAIVAGQPGFADRLGEV